MFSASGMTSGFAASLMTAQPGPGSNIPPYTTGGSESSRFSFTLPPNPSFPNFASGQSAFQPQPAARTQLSGIPSYSGSVAAAASQPSGPRTTARETTLPSPASASFSMGATPPRGKSNGGRESRHDPRSTPEAQPPSPAASSLFPDPILQAPAPMHSASTPIFGGGAFGGAGFGSGSGSQFGSTAQVQRNLFGSYAVNNGHPSAAVPASPQPAEGKKTPGEAKHLTVLAVIVPRSWAWASPGVNGHIGNRFWTVPLTNLQGRWVGMLSHVK